MTSEKQKRRHFHVRMRPYTKIYTKIKNVKKGCESSVMGGFPMCAHKCHTGALGNIHTR